MVWFGLSASAWECFMLQTAPELNDRTTVVLSKEQGGVFKTATDRRPSVLRHQSGGDDTASIVAKGRGSPNSILGTARVMVTEERFAFAPKSGNRFGSVSLGLSGKHGKSIN
ncbi:hypothetical protein GMOD_00000867 [Pyrenophora seminiperda CCB06]|uniref:Uncharacterized protein n=1 Tax=Pyrenophora seminiperda CCB06 TaxID=1302712 RepID=A0A3M7M8K8_9PLEO|nr:hypothetical protein GMOD_00000867 [Pyrenophora seminiperda CCB06]